jgi:hypothetical protein
MTNPKSSDVVEVMARAICYESDENPDQGLGRGMLRWHVYRPGAR